MRQCTIDNEQLTISDEKSLRGAWGFFVFLQIVKWLNLTILKF